MSADAQNGAYPSTSWNFHMKAEPQGVVDVVLRLRVAPHVWRSASEADPDFDRTVQSYMNGGSRWLFTEHTRGRASHLIETGDYRFWLARPTDPGDWDYDIIHLQKLRPSEHTPPASGAEIDTNIIVLAPTVKRTCSKRTVGVEEEPVSLTKHTQPIVFFLKIPTYRQLADHVREPFNMAWRRAKFGRSVRRVFWRADAIFILTADGTAPTFPDAAENLAQALEEAQVGRLITDPYEIKRAFQLVEKFGEDLTV